MRQMACHPDLVLKSKTNASSFDVDDIGEATVCRICTDVAEDAIQSKCRHIFDRECIKQYIESGIEQEVRAHNLCFDSEALMIPFLAHMPCLPCPLDN
jgi:hypothetical protein